MGKSLLLALHVVHAADDGGGSAAVKEIYWFCVKVFLLTVLGYAAVAGLVLWLVKLIFY